jgi:hypothetical protein
MDVFKITFPARKCVSKLKSEKGWAVAKPVERGTGWITARQPFFSLFTLFSMSRHPHQSCTTLDTQATPFLLDCNENQTDF